jgi:hypothetical protein
MTAHTGPQRPQPTREQAAQILADFEALCFAGDADYRRDVAVYLLDLAERIEAPE